VTQPVLRNVGTALAAVGRVVGNPDMRRALLGWMLGWAAEWAWLVALFVYAFGSGGLAVVGLVGMARTLPAAIAAARSVPVSRTHASTPSATTANSPICTPLSVEATVSS